MPAVPFATLLEARSARALDLRPDGALLVASDLTGSLQLYTTTLEGGPLRPVVGLAEPVGTARFVPGGGGVVLQVDRGGDENHRILLAADGGAGLRELAGEAHVKYQLADVSADGALLATITNRRNGTDFDVVVHDLRRGHEWTAFEGGHVVAATFSPDAAQVVVTTLGGLALNSDLFLVPSAGGTPRHLTPHDGAALSGGVAWAGDGTRFLFSTDIGREHAAIAACEPATGLWTVVHEDLWDAAVSTAAGASTVLLRTNEDGATRLRICDAATLAPIARLQLPPGAVADGAAATPEPLLAPDGRRVVATVTAAAMPSEVHLLTPGRPPRRITHSPSAIPAGLTVSPELVRIRSFDGLEVPLFLYRPRVRAGADAPATVLWIHGGPESQFVPAFNPVILHLVDAGFAVVAPNVRGSTGYGREYVHLDDGRRRLDSVADLAAIHAWLPRAGLDPGRAALVGGSYGGYMVLAGLAFQPDLWAAGVSIVGISSLVTFLENTSPYRRRVRELEYGSLEHDRDFLAEASPLGRVDRMRAPLLLVHGANDPRVPLSEAEQMHASLTARGVECELVVYPDEGHGLARLENRLDAYPRVAAFLARHLRP